MHRTLHKTKMKSEWFNKNRIISTLALHRFNEAAQMHLCCAERFKEQELSRALLVISLTEKKIKQAFYCERHLSFDWTKPSFKRSYMNNYQSTKRTTIRNPFFTSTQKLVYKRSTSHFDRIHSSFFKHNRPIYPTLGYDQ